MTVMTLMTGCLQKFPGHHDAPPKYVEHAVISIIPVMRHAAAAPGRWP
jgi:hypothetical protein